MKIKPAAATTTASLACIAAAWLAPLVLTLRADLKDERAARDKERQTYQERMDRERAAHAATRAQLDAVRQAWVDAVRLRAERELLLVSAPE